MDIVNKLIDNLVTDFNNKKDQIIKHKLQELGIEFIEEDEKSRRFKQFVCEIKGNEESYYYNDGSIDGLRIVTFVRKHVPLKFDSPNLCAELEISFY